MQFESLQEKMIPFYEGNQSNRKFYFAKDQISRQHQNGFVSQSFSCWSISPILYEGAVYVQVICIDIESPSFDPRELVNQDSDTYKIKGESGIRMVIYMEFSDFDDYNKFYVRATSDTYSGSCLLFHDFSSQIIDVNWFNNNGNLLANKRTSALKLSRSQWAIKVKSR